MHVLFSLSLATIRPAKTPRTCVPVPQVGKLHIYAAEVAFSLLSCTGEQWQRVDAAYQRFAPFRDSSMDRWHRKTMLMTGSGALRSNLKALNQSLAAQVQCPG